MPCGVFFYFSEFQVLSRIVLGRSTLCVPWSFDSGVSFVSARIFTCDPRDSCDPWRHAPNTGLENLCVSSVDYFFVNVITLIKLFYYAVLENPRNLFLLIIFL